MIKRNKRRRNGTELITYKYQYSMNCILTCSVYGNVLENVMDDFMFKEVLKGFETSCHESGFV